MKNNNYEQKKAELDGKNKKTAKIAIIIAAVIFTGLIFLGLIFGGGLFILGSMGENKEFTEISSGQQEQSGNQNAPTTEQNNPDTASFTNNPQKKAENAQQTENTRGDMPANGMQKVSAMDAKAGLEAFSINIPQGWTHTLDTVWNQKNNPMVNFQFNAKSPDGIANVGISPIFMFYDMPVMNGKNFMYHSVMKPKEAFTYFMDLYAKNDPKMASKGYKIVNSYDLPETQEGVYKTYESYLLANYTEDGIDKHEIVHAIVKVNNQYPAMPSWQLTTYYSNDKRSTPLKEIAGRLKPIISTINPNPQWLQKKEAQVGQWVAQNAQDTKIRQGQIQAQNEMFQARQNVYKNRQDSSERISNMQINALTGKSDYTNTTTGQTFKDDNSSKYIYTNPTNNERIYTNDSTYNPNSDINVNSVDWSQATEQ